MLLAGLWSARATYSSKGSLIQRVRRCGSGWPVAVQGALAVGTDGSDRAVGVEGQVPAQLVHRDQVVEGAEQEQVVQPGRPTLGPGPQVVDLAGGGWLGAAGERAVPVAGDDRPAQVPGHGGG